MISVLVPYRPDGAHRQRTWDWLRQRWAMLCPEAEVIVQGDDGGAHPGQFNHPLAINRAAERASHDVFIVADCDTAFDPGWVREAARLVAAEAEPWVMPRFYDKLTARATDILLSSSPATPLDEDNIAPMVAQREWRGDSICWSGLVVVHRSGFETVGGYDERIAWWGGDDICFGLTMDALVGRHHRLDGSAVHCWHPAPSEQTYGHERHAVQQELVDRYITAAENAAHLRHVRFG